MPLGTPCRDCGRVTPRPLCDICLGRRNAKRRETDPYQAPAWRRLAKRVTRRDGSCAHCGGYVRLTANHIIPRREGGPDEERNLMTLCGRCHSRYEADVRYERDTQARRTIDLLRETLIEQRAL